MRESGRDPERPELENDALRQRVATLEAEVRRSRATPHSIGDGVIATDAAGAAQRSYQALFDNVAVALLRSTPGPEGTLIDANPAMVKMFEADSRDQLLAVRPSDLYLDATERRIVSDSIVATGRIEAEVRFKTLKGKPIWCRITAVKAAAANGQICFDSTMEDITARKAAEQELLDAREGLEQRIVARTAELQWSKELLDATGELARVGGWEIDLERNELSWTEVVHQIHEVEPGYRPTVEAGINFYAPEAVPVISEAVRCAVEHGQPFDVELQLVTAKKNRIWVRAVGEALRENGRIVKVRGVFQDIHQRKLAELELRKHREHLEELVEQRTAELRESQRTLVQAHDDLERRVRDRTAQLEESNQELEAFSYSVSHDLRAPLRAIDGFTHILADDYASQLPPEGQRLCSIVRENAGKMSRLIDDLLAFSRLGRAEMCLSRVDMGTMADSVFHELTTPETRARIDFRVATVPAAVADPTLMRQVWTNLLSNAIKFSSKGERAVITVSGRQSEGEVVYAVQDDGAGFDMQYVGKLFGVFQRLHSAREFEGTGVGLALVQRVIRRHGGRVWAQGQPDRGATFSFAIESR